MEFSFKSISLGHIIKTVYLFLITYSNSSKFSYPNSIKTWRLCFLSSSVLNLGIETVFATKRTTVECYKRGDALAVYREAVAVDANEWGGLHVILL